MSIFLLCEGAIWIKGDYAIICIGALLPLIVAVEFVRIGFWAKKHNKKGVWVIVVANCSFLLLYVIAECFYTYNWATTVTKLSIIVSPVGMTIFLARQTGITNNTLELKLRELLALSEKNTAIQLEKQQILALQNETLEHRVSERTFELNKSLADLKSAQTQLIQAEKMALLGELTAGIAHEIQNPLNFVNNFSEVSAELLDELDEELNRGDIGEAKAVASDVKQNLEKIRHHGKRADSIVKGMLEHSRVSSGQKEPTNLNILTDEYLRLAYHGLRAKDKNFNTELVTNFDQNLPSVDVIPQDVSRVLLNLFNNAFYAVNQKEKTVGNGYKPVVEVSTARQNGSVLIKVKDNGTGIPDSVKDKIMQPFFTTKPTGEGTGLGLSLSYDIVVKGHGGKIDVESEAGNGSEFTVSLPLN
jgi:signal transduction histidine kinase